MEVFMINQSEKRSANRVIFPYIANIELNGRRDTIQINDISVFGMNINNSIDLELDDTFKIYPILPEYYNISSLELFGRVVRKNELDKNIGFSISANSFGSLISLNKVILSQKKSQF
jgi:ribosome-interacting GTPase 1